MYAAEIVSNAPSISPRRKRITNLLHLHPVFNAGRSREVPSPGAGSARDQAVEFTADGASRVAGHFARHVPIDERLFGIGRCGRGVGGVAIISGGNGENGAEDDAENDAHERL